MTDDAASNDRERSKNLTVLITNIAFAFRSGTEIVVDQISRRLRQRGHRPIVFAPYIGGELTKSLRRNGIAVVDRLNQVGFTPDIIHGHHNVATVMALTAFPTTPALFICHDFDSMADRAPIMPRIRRYLAVDELCRERLVRDGAPEDKTALLYNAVDIEQYARRSCLPQQPERVLVLTKGKAHLPAVRSAVQRAGLKLHELGPGPGKIVDDLSARLQSYDLVIATARMAKEAMAAGCAVVVADDRGFAGLVTTGVVADWRRHNFGRRILTDRLTEDRLLQAIAHYDPADAAKVTDIIRAEDNLDAQIDQLERIYNSILYDPIAVNPAEDMKSLSAFLEDFLISPNFLRPWAELYSRVVGDSIDVVEFALNRHSMKIEAMISEFLDVLAGSEATQRAKSSGLIQSIDLALFKLHGDATAQFDEHLSFTTPVRQWDYALSIECPLITVPSYIEIETQIDAGAVGFGLSHCDLLDEETVVLAGRGRRLIRIAVPNPTLVRMMLIIRNVGDNGERSHGIVYRATVVAAHVL